MMGMTVRDIVMIGSCDVVVVVVVVIIVQREILCGSLIPIPFVYLYIRNVQSILVDGNQRHLDQQL